MKEDPIAGEGPAEDKNSVVPCSMLKNKRPLSASGPLASGTSLARIKIREEAQEIAVLNAVAKTKHENWTRWARAKLKSTETEKSGRPAKP